MSKILILAAGGVAAVALSAGVGVAAAGQSTDRPTPDHPTDMAPMDEMHAAMADQMPAELVEQCDRMHAAMSQHMGDGNHTAHHPRAMR